MTGDRDPERSYVERRRRRRRAWLLGLLAVVTVALVTARRPDRADPCDAPAAASEAARALLPEGLSLAGIGTVTSVRKEAPNVVIQVVTTKPVDEVALLLQDAGAAAGYRPAGIETEPTEGEVFFDAGAYAGGQARIEPAACHGRWDVELVLLDLGALPPPTTTTG